MMEKDQGRARYSYIDALRAVAALLVVWSHAIISFVEKNSFVAMRDSQWLSSTWPIHIGTMGVVIFFAISGYLIPSSLKEPVQEGTRKFLIRRFFRLYPAYWISLIVMLATFYIEYSNSTSFGEKIAYITMVPYLFGARSIGPFWTLQIEMLFYAICLGAFLLKILNHTRFLSYITLGLAFVFVIANLGLIIDKPIFQDIRILSAQLSIMTWGSLWRKRQEGITIKGLDRLVLFVIPIAWVVLLPLAGIILSVIKPSQHNPLVMGLTYGGGILIFVLGTTISKLKMRWLAWLGEISYSLYLFHIPIVIFLSKYSASSVAPEWLKKPSMFTYVLCSIILSVAVSVVTYYLVEKPAMKLGHLLSANKAKAVLEGNKLVLKAKESG